MLQSKQPQWEQSKWNSISRTKVRCISLVCSLNIFFYLTLFVSNKKSSDTPYALGLAALESIPTLTNTVNTGFAWTLYTGDLVSHDPDNQLSRFVLSLSSTRERSSFFTGVMLNMLRYSAFKLHLINHPSYLSTDCAVRPSETDARIRPCLCCSWKSR